MDQVKSYKGKKTGLMEELIRMIDSWMKINDFESWLWTCLIPSLEMIIVTIMFFVTMATPVSYAYNTF